MTDIQINLRIEEKLAVMDLVGEVTAAAEERIVKSFDKAVAQKARCVILNFAKVNYINSAGMSIIISLLTKAQKKQLTMSAFGLSPHFQKIFEMVGLSKYVPHFDSEAEARQHCP